MAVGNTFGATALSSYGGFWLSFAIVFTPSFNVEGAYAETEDFLHAFGFYLAGWFIFNTILVLCTLRSTLAFFLLFFFLDLALLLLAIAYLHLDDGAPRLACNKAGGVFGLFSAFMAWYNAFAGIADDRYVALTRYNSAHRRADLLLATPSSSFLCCTSHGPPRPARRASRPSARLSKQQLAALLLGTPARPPEDEKIEKERKICCFGVGTIGSIYQELSEWHV